MSAFVTVGLWAVVHIFANRLKFLDGIPRSRWLSFAGGASVAYVFLHLLPELEEAHGELQELPALAHVEQPSYLIAAIGLIIFYGLEVLALRSRRTTRFNGNAEHAETPAPVFWIHIGSFSIYNAIAAYLLVMRPPQTSIWIYGSALAFHFVVNDYGLREHHKSRYNQIGRWVLSAALLCGWVAGVLAIFPGSAIIPLMALLSGGIIMNVLKEELPEKRESSYVPFVVGAAAYGALMLAL